MVIPSIYICSTSSVIVYCVFSSYLIVYIQLRGIRLSTTSSLVLTLILTRFMHPPSWISVCCFRKPWQSSEESSDEDSPHLRLAPVRKQERNENTFIVTWWSHTSSVRFRFRSVVAWRLMPSDDTNILKWPRNPRGTPYAPHRRRGCTAMFHVICYTRGKCVICWTIK
jgi:hypothetical protein